MRKPMLCLVALLVGVLVLGCVQMSAKEIAKKVEEKYDAIRDMKGTVVITTNFQGKKKVEVIIKVEFLRKNIAIAGPLLAIVFPGIVSVIIAFLRVRYVHKVDYKPNLKNFFMFLSIVSFDIFNTGSFVFDLSGTRFR